MIPRPSKTIREVGEDEKTSIRQNPHFATWLEDEKVPLRAYHNSRLPLGGMVQSGAITNLQEVFTGQQLVGLRTLSVTKSIPDSAVVGTLAREGYVTYDPDVDIDNNGKADLFYSLTGNILTVELAYFANRSQFFTLDPSNGNQIPIPNWATSASSIMVSFNQPVGERPIRDIRVSFAHTSAEIEVDNDDVRTGDRNGAHRHLGGTLSNNILSFQRYLLDEGAFKVVLVVSVPDGDSVANVSFFPVVGLAVAGDAPDFVTSLGLRRSAINYLGSSVGGTMRFTFPVLSSSGEPITSVAQEVVVGSNLAIATSAMTDYVQSQIQASGGKITAALEAMQADMRAADNQILRISTAVAMQTLSFPNFPDVASVPADQYAAVVAGEMYYRDAQGDLHLVDGASVAEAGPPVAALIAALDPEGSAEVETIKTDAAALTATVSALLTRIAAAEAKLAETPAVEKLTCDQLTPAFIDCVGARLEQIGFLKGDVNAREITDFNRHNSGTRQNGEGTDGPADVAGGAYRTFPAQSGFRFDGTIEAGKTYRITVPIYLPSTTGTLQANIFIRETDAVTFGYLGARLEYLNITTAGIGDPTQPTTVNDAFVLSDVTPPPTYSAAHSRLAVVEFTPAANGFVAFSMNSNLGADWALGGPLLEEIL